MELSITTLQIIGGAKIMLFIFVFLLVLFIWKKAKPWMYLIIITAAVAGFYYLLSDSMQKMFWANNGDEVFIFSFLTKVLAGDYFTDFYYSHLPPFYPPLYFWITGTVAKIFTANGIMAARIGTFLTLLVWFIGPYFFQKLFWLFDPKKEKPSIIKSKWFWLLTPIIFFLSVDFDAIILKPYETLPALLCVLLIGFIAQSFDWDKWSWKNYIFIGISGGLLFLTYYFWWFILIPAIFTLALLSEYKSKNILRIILFGLIIFIISSPYLIPLLKSYIEFGMENWQAAYFVPPDLSTFVPWFDLNLKSIILIIGLIGLIWFRRKKFIKASLVTFVFAFIYQLINVLIFAFGAKPAQAAKPFLFLGTACLTIGAAYLTIYLFQKYTAKLELKYQKSIALILILLFIPLMPFVRFVDDPVVQNQIEKDLKIPEIKPLADFIKQNIDFQDRIWLSSGAPEINAYIPLTYYIAHNPHFSHHAANYSKRFTEIENMTQAQTADKFMQIIQQGQPQKIDSLILYFDKTTNTYPLFFWSDNYPNGGKELRLDLPKNLIDEKYWQKVYNEDEWYIFIKKYEK